MRRALVLAVSIVATSAAQAQDRTREEFLGDTARGAAKGAIIGAVAGDAGKGAVAGAVGGAVFGGVERRTPDTVGGDLVSGAAKGGGIPAAHGG